MSEPDFAQLGDAWRAIKENIEAEQGALRDLLSNLRETHGKKAAAAFKVAMKLDALTPEQRSDAEDVETEAFRILQIVQAPRAPRATHTHESNPYAAAQAGNEKQDGTASHRVQNAAPQRDGRDAVDPVVTRPAHGEVSPEGATQSDAGFPIAGAENPSPVTGSDTGPATQFSAVQLRPHCLQPDNCGRTCDRAHTTSTESAQP